MNDSTIQLLGYLIHQAALEGRVRGDVTAISLEGERDVVNYTNAKGKEVTLVINRGTDVDRIINRFGVRERR